ncbi:sigma-70 family RNA polymerase sigma factor [Verticiella sediminum]|uniref:Sigma-70 family RNA polymerase sigma factor n=1 Tax=Verticiella sediminum TaxID=1247510 RepID=A0A556AIM3_9BURK|nr:sigma-70 family RNA polymerase sigma factor [Verticiella sediminum]TSH92729.1 sigma-70 family RNA polymerase sigma factor [Verticiella sediminum]
MSRLDSSAPDFGAVLYVQHHDWLRTWLRRNLPSSHDAEDVAHDTFVRVLRARVDAQLREPRAYLATVARRLVANFHRRRAIELAYLEVLASLPEERVPSAEVQAVMCERLTELDAMLDGLGRKVKQAFLLAHFDGLAYPQIAERLGVSVRTVQNHVATAVAHCCLLMD